ncbi:hypothetical protein ACFP2T_16315 [Plantactinospora solaniradicis]|uniref:Uncharacterized protein n=1 Tax=Plantactinospora solaniradicis TaxID=1723736 RepID=A0ABW1K7G2_9ACTN
MTAPRWPRLAALFHRTRTDEHPGADATWSPLADLPADDGRLIAPAADYEPRHAAQHAEPEVDQTIEIPGVIAVDSHGIAVDIPPQTVTVAAPSAVPAWVRAPKAGPDTFIPAGELELTGRLDPREVTQS